MVDLTSHFLNNQRKIMFFQANINLKLHSAQIGNRLITASQNAENIANSTILLYYIQNFLHVLVMLTKFKHITLI